MSADTTSDEQQVVESPADSIATEEEVTLAAGTDTATAAPSQTVERDTMQLPMVAFLCAASFFMVKHALRGPEIVKLPSAAKQSSSAQKTPKVFQGF